MEIDDLYNIEYKIAKTAGKLRKHIEKWAQIKPDLVLTDQEIQRENDYIAQYLALM